MVTAIAIAFLGRDRGSLVAAIVLVGLVAAKSPLLAIPFIAGIVLLVIERRWSEEGRLHLPWPRIHEALTLFVGVLFLVQVVQFATRSDPPPLVAADAWAGQPLNDAARPNIYLILADAHGREDILRDDYDYDDRALLDKLEDQGFDVSPESRSNYGLTRFSIGSMLTGSYLDRLKDEASTTTQDDTARRTIHDNPAFPLLRRAGYEVTVISSGYEHLGLRSADRFVDTGQPNEFESVVAKNIAATGLWTALQPDGDSRRSAPARATRWHPSSSSPRIQTPGRGSSSRTCPRHTGRTCSRRPASPRTRSRVRPKGSVEAAATRRPSLRSPPRRSASTPCSR